MRHAMQCFAQATPASEVREMPGVLIANAGVDTPVFNTAFLTSPPQDLVDLDRRIAIAKVYYEARGLHWSYWVCEDLLEACPRRRAASVFRRRGLRAATECAGMLAEQIPAASREAPPIECRRVSDAETRMAFCHITSACFGIPFETSLAIYNSAKTWQTDFIAYTAYLEGQPVATAATVTAAGAIGLYSVATLPAYQRRGIAEALSRHAIGEAQHAAGMQPSVLQATRPGQALYRRMGYRHVTRITVYVSD